MGLRTKLRNTKESLKNDHNLKAARRSIVRGAHALPSAASRWAVQKVPMVEWLPKYSPKWLINDIIAGVTVGFLLIPQALAFAALAGIPLQDGLIASWLPPLIYSIMGTSKGRSLIRSVARY